MLSHQIAPTAQIGEAQASPEFVVRRAHLGNALVGVQAAQADSRDSGDATAAVEPQQYWFTNHPEYDAKSVADLVITNESSGFTMRAGDAVYVAEIRRHVLTDDDLNAAARAVIGGAA